MEPNAVQKKRAEWTEEQMEQALNAVGNGMSVNQASKEFRIPRRTLRNHLTTGISSRKLGRNTILSSDQETELCSRIFRLADVGMPITSKIIGRSVFSFCEENNITHTFNPMKQKAGRKWLRLFLGRHPDVARRKTQNLNPARASKLNKVIVTDYFDKLKVAMEELDVAGKPQNIYNIDEKGCRLTLHHQQEVLAKKGSKRVHIVAPEHAENVTIVSCANAGGQYIPPMILFKGQRLKPEWEENFPPGTKVVMTPKGCMTHTVFVKWIEHFQQFRVGGKNTLLIFDGVKSHLDANIVKAAEKYDITLFCLPINTTHELQPMDKSVFKSFESFWDDEILRFWMNNPERSIRRTVFGRIFSEVWAKAMTPGNIISGFKATGIYPFNPSVIPESAYAPSCLTELENGNQKKSAESEQSTSAEPMNQSSATRIKTLLPQRSSKYQDVSSESDDSSNYSIHDTSDNEDMGPVPTVTFKDTTSKLNTSFTEMLSTPKIKTKRIQRKKSINSRAQKLVVNLFDAPSDKGDAAPKIIKKKNEQPKRLQMKMKIESSRGEIVDPSLPSTSGTIKKPSTKSSQRGLSHKESWYCFVCDEDEIKDMRMCSACGRYVHEECVGLTQSDKDAFICPKCTF